MKEKLVAIIAKTHFRVFSEVISSSIGLLNIMILLNWGEMWQKKDDTTQINAIKLTDHTQVAF